MVIQGCMQELQTNQSSDSLQTDQQTGILVTCNLATVLVLHSAGHYQCNQYTNNNTVTSPLYSSLPERHESNSC